MIYFQIVVPHNHYVSILTNTIVPLNKKSCFALYVIWIDSLGLSVGGVSILFYYRYRTLCLNKKFSIKLQLICLFSTTLLASCLPIAYYYYYYHYDFEKLKISEEIVSYFSKENGKVDAVFLIDTVRWS